MDTALAVPIKSCGASCRRVIAMMQATSSSSVPLMRLTLGWPHVDMGKNFGRR